MKKNKIIKTGYQILKSRLMNKRMPISVLFSVIGECNFNCKYCNRWKNDKHNLKTEDIYLLFDELAEMGTQNVTLFGGEPLLRRDIGRIVDYGKNKGFFMALSSNAYLLPKRFDEIKKIDLLMMSFDGPKKVNDKLRKKGSYDSIIKSIKLANKQHIEVNTYTLLTKYNIDQIDFILDKAEELGFKASFVYLSNDPQASKTLNKFYPDKKDYTKAINKLIDYKKDGRPILNSIGGLKYMAELPNPQEKIECWAGRLHIHITPDGRICSCVSKRQHKNNVKTFPQISFKEAFDNLYIDEGKCKYCVSPGLFERNKIFSLNPRFIFNEVRKWI